MRPRDLKAIRKQRGLSQERLGKALGVDRVSINRWENGQIPVPRMAGLAVLYLKSNRKSA